GGIKIPAKREEAKHVYHQYSVLVDGFKLSREELIEHLKKNEVGSAVFYPKPLHLHPHFQRQGFNEGDFPFSEMVSKQILSLPVHPGVTEEDAAKIIDTIKKA
ncbi:DegT/DnrJ/EryC1/StrS aminotransferase family protein, partial [Candidatus Woesearchaeota archaeon]|nr:DegT/DnrJ/EryC1/StrS aminotransferase family protein [Candidatus Woesearchaeota archaeon]